MHINADAWATALLTVPLKSPDGPRALTLAEWARLSAWLDERHLGPGQLVSDSSDRILADWVDHRITADRVRRLLGRGRVLETSIQRWHSDRLTLLTLSGEAYPKRLRRRLARKAPPVLFATGNTVLLDQGGLAVVGSRDASEEECAYASKLGERAWREHICIVSGGARGIDQHAMLGALESGGPAVAVLPNNIARTAASARLREHIEGGRLALVTPFSPDAGWNAGLALGRNKYIYCLADAAVAVASVEGRGGTWAGAAENLRRDWVPLWVKESHDPRSGSPGLAERGARWLPDGRYAVAALMASPSKADCRDGIQTTLQF